jgi:TolA-binding protein
MGILIMGISLIVGCTPFMEPLGDNALPPPSPPDNGPLEYALSIYQKGDYTQAATLFNDLSKSNTGDNQYLKAQLGSICCRLILAASPEDLSAAREMWKNLTYSTTGDNWRVEQALFDPLIDRLSASAEKPVQRASSTPVAPKKQSKNELAVLKKKTARVTQLQRQLDAVMAENQILKQKIKALEAIDQNIQKKKTEISAPSE